MNYVLSDSLHDPIEAQPKMADCLNSSTGVYHVPAILKQFFLQLLPKLIALFV